MPEYDKQNNSYDTAFEIHKTIISILKEKDEDYYELFEDYVTKTTLLCAVTGACISFILYFLFRNPLISVLVMALGCFFAGLYHKGGMAMMVEEAMELQKDYNEVLDSVRATFEEAKEGEDR